MSVRTNALNLKFDERTIEVPEWDGKVTVRAMSAREREQFITNREPGFLYADAVIACTLDPDTGEHVFDVADRDQLAASPAGPLERVFGEIAELSALGEKAVDEAKDRLKDDPFDASA